MACERCRNLHTCDNSPGTFGHMSDRRSLWRMKRTSGYQIELPSVGHTVVLRGVDEMLFADLANRLGKTRLPWLDEKTLNWMKLRTARRPRFSDWSISVKPCPTALPVSIWRCPCPRMSRFSVLKANECRRCTYISMASTIFMQCCEAFEKDKVPCGTRNQDITTSTCTSGWHARLELLSACRFCKVYIGPELQQPRFALSNMKGFVQPRL